MLGDHPRREAGPLARVIGVFGRIDLGQFIRVRRAGGGELHDEIVAKRGDLSRVDPDLGELFKVAEMIGPAAAGLFHDEVRHVTPTVAFAGEKQHALDVRGLADEGRELSRQGLQRELVDHAVTVVIPSRERRGGSENG